MGGSESGYLAMQLDTPSIQAGSAITGVIHFHLRTHICAQSLALKLSGKERTSWEGGGGSENPYTNRGKKKFITAILQLFLFQDGQVAPGDYSFPFAMGTSASLPGTFHYDHAGTIADLQYTLCAFLQGSKVQARKAKAEVVVNACMPQIAINVQELKLAHILTWCCSNKGEVRLSAVFNKNAYILGETAIVGVEVDNSQSRLDVTQVDILLNCAIRLRAGSATALVLTTGLNGKRITNRIAAGQAATGPNALQVSLPIDTSRQGLQHSTTLRGQLIECIFTVEVKVTMNGSCMCCSETPAVQQEVQIYSMQQSTVALPQVPPGWNPTVMPLVQFAEVQNYSVPAN